ncbi:MAG: hypothetical protein Q7T54_05490 [Candidatus Levybacteria bacterium]|nr:hypothetical protein [Candidatus Levybacteria bacterium]
MVAFLYYPFYLILFWYKTVIGGIFTFFIEFNRYTASLLSLPLLLHTFFKPLKNEYRDGLVLFSIVFGMIIKTALILISASIIFVLLLTEVLIALFLIALPFGAILLLVGGDVFVQ